MAAKVLDGRYKLIKALGVGGFGRTFVARDMRRPGSPTCVVKQLKPASTDANFIREARRLFNTEAETLEKLGKHDQIPQLLAYFEEDQQFFLVQEFIEGRSLFSELRAIDPPPEVEAAKDPIQDSKPESHAPKRGRQVSEPEAIAILKDILLVLEFVHAEGVIHRDIKPDNLIRRKQDQRLVLIDFGAVKAMQEGAQLESNPDGQSRFTVTIGTPGYMSSEQCAGRPNFTSDLYAAGMVTIKALTGFEPTELPTDPATGELIWRNHAKISNGLAMVLTRMVKYHYKQRYQSAKEVQQALNAFLLTPEEPGALVINPGKSGGSAKTIAKSQTQSNAGAEWLIGGLLLVVIGLASVTFFQFGRPKPNETASQPDPVVIKQPIVTTLPATRSPSPNPTTNPPSLEYKSLLPEAGKEIAQEGELKPNQAIAFTFNAKQGQNIKVQLTAANATMSVFGADEKPVDANASQISTWTGAAVTDGAYQVRVAASNQTSYKLTVLLEPSGTERSIQIR